MAGQVPGRAGDGVNFGPERQRQSQQRAVVVKSLQGLAGFYQPVNARQSIEKTH